MRYPHPTWLEINLSAVEANTRLVLEHTGTTLMAVVKANAYGFGAVQIAHSVLAAGARWLGVARFCEALELRQANIEAPILVFGMLTVEEIDAAANMGVTLTLTDLAGAELMNRRAEEMGKTLYVHLEIDTGMGRFGVLAQDVLDLATEVRSMKHLQLDGVFTHFSTADSIPNDPFLKTQLTRFEEVITALRREGIQPQWIHAANSAAALGYPQTCYNLVRVGSGLLGISPFYFTPLPDYLRRVLTWKAQLASVRRIPPGWGISYGQTYRTLGEEYIGVIPVGYADGYRRSEHNEVLVDGQRVPVVGRVCTDLSMVRLPGEISIGSEVVIIGEQGENSITIEDLAERWGISYANVTSPLHARLPRLYVRD